MLSGGRMLYVSGNVIVWPSRITDIDNNRSSGGFSVGISSRVKGKVPERVEWFSRSGIFHLAYVPPIKKK